MFSFKLQLLITYIETNRQHFEGFLDTEEAFDEYLLNLRRDEHYAGETAIQA